MTDLSKLSSSDLQAIAAGDMSKVSEAGLMHLSGQTSAAPPAPTTSGDTSLLQDVGQGVADLGAGALSGAINVSKGILALPKLVGLPPVGGQDWHDRVADSQKWLMRDRGAMGSLGEFAGEMAGTAGIGSAKAVGAAARYLPRALQWAARSPAVIAALDGAASGAILGQGDWGDVGTGAAGGAIGQAVLGRLGKMIAQPSKQTAQAQMLRRMGIDVTAGQGAEGGVIKGLEEAAQYIPGAATAVRKQRAVPYQQLRDLAARTAQPPVDALRGATKMAPVGEHMDDVLSNAAKNFSSQYEGVLAGKTFTPDADFQTALARLKTNPDIVLSHSERNALAQMINDQLVDGLNAGQWAGPELSKIRAAISRKAASSTNPEMGRGLEAASEELLNLMRRQSPEVGTVYDRLAKPYSNLKTLQAAAKGAQAQGDFGVGALASAGEATGNQRLRDFGRMAATVLKDDVNKGGASIRAALGLAGVGAGYALGGAGGAGASAAVPAALYLGLGTRTGQKALAGQFKTQKALAEFLRRHPDFGTTLGANMAVDASGEDNAP